jgi:hypothetical protein
VKKLFVLMLVVLSVVGFVSSTTQAHANHPCPTGYYPGDFSKTYYIDGGDGTPAAKVIISAEYCYNAINDLIVNYYSVSPIPLHRLWANSGETITQVDYCSNSPDCRQYYARVKFNRIYADGRPRSAICATYSLTLSAHGFMWENTLNPKYTC